jgi:peptidoglycan/LPS O-acetylase OafA/YrhL
MPANLNPKKQARPAGKPRHQPELDGIRGIAIIAVLLSHAVGMEVLPHHMPHPRWVSLVSLALTPGWGGVDLFFTLSGFLITGILLRARESATYFSSFYARRLLRIFPIYYLFLSVTLAASYIWPTFGAHLPATAEERLSYFLYLQNWPVFWSSWAGLTSIWGVFWSLAVEEQFYLVWPTLVRFARVPWMLSFCLFGFALGTPLRWVVMHRLTGVTEGVLHFPLSRLDGLFLGAACALYREYRGRPVPLAWAGSSFTAGAAILLFIAAFHTTELFGVGVHISVLGVTAFALMATGLVAASQHRVGWLHRVLTARPLIVAGKYSYGMYVYHAVLFLGFTWLARRLSPATAGEFSVWAALAYIVAALLVVTAVAAFSFHIFEAPLLKLKRHFPSPGSSD